MMRCVIKDPMGFAVPAIGLILISALFSVGCGIKGPPVPYVEAHSDKKAETRAETPDGGAEAAEEGEAK